MYIGNEINIARMAKPTTAPPCPEHNQLGWYPSQKPLAIIIAVNQPVTSAEKNAATVNNSDFIYAYWYT